MGTTTSKTERENSVSTSLRLPSNTLTRNDPAFFTLLRLTCSEECVVPAELQIKFRRARSDERGWRQLTPVRPSAPVQPDWGHGSAVSRVHVAHPITSLKTVE